MLRKLRDYTGVAGKTAIQEIRKEAEPLKEKHLVHVNSTLYGGGVAEILSNFVFLMNDAGIQSGWRVMKGSPEFFTTTKKFHNALQGEKIRLSELKKKIYMEFNEAMSLISHIDDSDFIIVHDIQPLPLIKFYKKRQPWIWRCHVDLSKPNTEMWAYAKHFVQMYDRMVVSMDSFRQNASIPQTTITPSIDPLSSKNRKTTEKRVTKYLSKKGIDRDKPIVSQISRFDKWKDPVGVIKAYEMIKKKCNCQLVLMGSTAVDDPESQGIYEKTVKKAHGKKDIHLITEQNSFLVNVLQRASGVVLQKSTREGFGLTVSEALWKGTPVVATNAGGIPLQVIDGETGFLVKSNRECAKKTLQLLKDEKLRERLGANGREHVKKHFLVTRHLLDYLKMLNGFS